MYLLFILTMVFAQSAPKIELRSDDKATLTFFQAIQTAVEGNTGLRRCTERAVITSDDRTRLRNHRFWAKVLKSGELSLDPDLKRKEKGSGWAQLPEAYRQRDACLREQLERTRLPRPDQPLRIEILIRL